MEVIVLAGGKGTRLRSKVSDVPKVMADVNGRPFLEYLFEKISKYEIDKIILSIGYKKECIKDYFGDCYKNIKIEYSIEDKPLGTGGAIKKALKLCDNDYAFVIYGDVYTEIDYDEMNNMYNNEDVYMALKKIKNADRYGIVNINKNKIISFEEKKKVEEGLINIGCYIIRKNVLNNYLDDEFFSIENDFFSKWITNYNNSYYLYNGEFIDMGVPNDYDELIKKLSNR